MIVRTKKSVAVGRLIGMIIVVALIVVAAFWMLVSTVDNQILASNTAAMRELALHDGNSINNSISLRWDDMAAMADELGENVYNTGKELMTALKKAVKYVPGANAVVLLDSEGTFYRSTGMVGEGGYIAEACEGQTDSFVLRINTKSYFIENSHEVLLQGVKADFCVDDKKIEWVVCEYPISLLKSELKIDAYGGEGYSSVIDYEGNFVVNISETHNFLVYDNFFTQYASVSLEGGYGDMRAFVETARGGESVSTTYKSGGEEYIIVATGMEIADWYFITIVPSHVFDEQSNVIMNTFVALLTALVGMCVGVFVLVFRHRKQQEKLLLAQIASKSKTEFLFNMSHDIRTPMNAIKGFTDMARRSLDDKEKLKECLQKTDEAGTLLLSLINSILDMSRIEAGHVKPNEKPADIRESFLGLNATLDEIARDNNITLSFEIGKIDNPYVYTDTDRCNRIFINIITNGIKYSKPGGYVKSKCEQISPVKDGRATYRYTFEDNGIGMSEEFRKKAFDRFSREENTTASGVQGTGLGLSVCKSYVELMGGTIGCESERGVGTTFTIELSLKIWDKPEEKPTDKAESKGQAALEGKKVLVFEDNELNREIVVDILEMLGMEADTAENGRVGVDILKEKGAEYYDFVLMDIQMPVLDGYGAAKEIRAMFPDAHLPIIALSANAFEEDKKASLAAGMNDHVAKPINVGELTKAMLKF